MPTDPNAERKEDVSPVNTNRGLVNTLGAVSTVRKSAFLWVNKDRNSGLLTRSDARETTAIRKHVHVQRRKARAEKVSALAASSLGQVLHVSGSTTDYRYPCGYQCSVNGEASSGSSPGSVGKADEEQTSHDEGVRIEVHITSDGNCILTNPFGLYPAQHVVSAQSAMKWCM